MRGTFGHPDQGNDQRSLAAFRLRRQTMPGQNGLPRLTGLLIGSSTVTTRTELLELIRNGENSGVEFKRDTLEIKDLAKELVAFANFRGGHVLLGVDDDGTIVGITRPNLEEWVMTACRDKIRPEIVPYFEVVRDAVPGLDVAVVSVAPGYAVHSMWHNQHYSYYQRVGTQSRELNVEELSRLAQRRGMLRAELQPVSGSGIDDLDPRRLEDYFVRVRGLDLPPDSGELRRILVNTEFLDSDGPATLAGLLLFGRAVRRFLPHASITAAAYPGVEKDYATIERATLRGPMTALSGESGLVDPGIVEQAAYFVARNTGATARLVDGVRREDVPTYPPDVIREALVNAVVHRDYLLTATDIELSIFADRLELTSPGRLPNGVTVEAMRIGVRAARNQLLKDVMGDYGYLEHRGLGVPRKIIAGMRAHNGTEPDFIEWEERLTVRLWKARPER
jgi:ATP-dependent DNA helicase RecG